MFSRNIIKQIVLITDGHANKGQCPVRAARAARDEGISLSIIGILDTGRLGSKGRRNIQMLAQAGGGGCQFVPSEDIGITAYSVSRQVTRKSIEIHLDRLLEKKAGLGLRDLPPSGRANLLPLADRLEDEAELHLALVIDTSISMASKRPFLEQGICDFLLLLGSRRGLTRLAVVQYPGPSGCGTVIKSPHTCNSVTSGLLTAMTYGGLTPTGPAISLAVAVLSGPGNRGLSANPEFNRGQRSDWA